MKQSRFSPFFSRMLCAASLLFAVGLLASPSQAQTDLADQPASQPKVPNNLLLSLSVEYPTAVAVAYPYVSGNYTSSTCNNGSSNSSGSGIPYCNITTSTYLGYFDPAKCYTYYTSSTDANAPYFKPYGAAASTTNGSSGTSGYTCTSSSTNKLWSGNWLNWASMQTIDVFRATLTGGYRSVDTNSLTILQKGWSSNQGSYNNSGSDTPDKVLSNSSDISGATPFKSSSGWTTVSSRIGQLGYVMWVTGTSSDLDETNRSTTSSTDPSLGLNSTGGSLSTTPIAYNGQNSYVTSSNAAYADPTQIYALQIRVQVCSPTVSVESNCTYYGANANNYKPEGLIQQYALSMRFAAMGYLDDSNSARDGGVLRASMKFVGPTQPVIGASNTTNTLAEWSSLDGTYVTNPSPKDIALSANSPSPAVGNSGVINYLNKFGQSSGIYKSADPVSELYYAGIRYFENVGTTGAPSGYDATTPKTSPAPDPYVNNLTSTFVDGFPVVTTWTDPILYSCQFNYILGIGDVNTHNDADVPGSAVTDSGDTPSLIPNDNILSAVSYSGQTGVGAANAMVANLEGFPGATGQTPCCTATYNIAGLAYYAHTNDLRPNDFKTADNLNTDGTKKYTQTINSTYWLDVQEYQQYKVNNQYYLATKWGGFSIPGGFLPWSTSNTNTSYVPKLAIGSTPTPMTLASWDTNGGIQGSNSCNKTTPDSTNFGSAATCNWQPDNYFAALDARQMVKGLQSAFSKAGSGGIGYGTAFAAVSANITSSSGGNISYSSNYTPSPAWSGDVIGNTVTFDSNGDVTASKIWDAAGILTGTGTGTGTSATVAQMQTLAANRIIVTCCQSSAPTTDTFTTPPASGGWGFPFEATTTSGTSLSTTTFARTNYASFGNVPNVATAIQDQVKYANYLRGDREFEVCLSTSTSTCTVTNGYYRSRTTLLGDIVNSQVTAVGVPSASYSDSTNPGYSSFVSTYSARKAIAYVGANDGMMHAFDGTNGTTGGKELFAYVPSFVYGCDNTGGCSSTSTPSATNPVISSVNGLSSLGNTIFAHHYLVDSTPIVTDVDLKNTGGASTSASTAKWASVLIGGLGKGGHGYYAIDVTDPSTWTSETAVAGKVLWEFTDSRMGDSYGTPVVVKTTQYGWVVILTSGYNNSDGQGYFFVVNVATGQLLQVIPVNATGATATNQTGLAHPTAYVNDYTNFTADSVYAGDLLGNLWRLDLTSSSSTYTVTQLATLTDPSGNAQPVTTDPFPEQQPNTLNRYVFVGTGRSLGTSDTSNTQIQTFYAIIDGKSAPGAFYGSGTGNTVLPTGVSFPVTRSNLVANTNLLTGITLDTTKPMGWYYDLTTDPTTGVAERINIDPAAYYGIIGFAANLPTGATATTACSPGGTSRIFAATFATGKTALTDPANSATAISYSNAVTGVVEQLQFQNINGNVFLEAGSNTGARVSVKGSWISNGALHRVNWREVPTAD